jgi:hypothetical protein
MLHRASSNFTTIMEVLPDTDIINKLFYMSDKM